LRLGCDIPYFASPIDLRRYVEGVERLGFDFAGYAGHVACTLDTAFPAPFFTFDEPWRESFTMGSFVAALTSRLELNPAMVLLPLYPPVLAAKQAAELANLSQGRLRLAASIGWNTRECETLGVDPRTRAARFEEQVLLIRRLWTERSVNHGGRFFTIDQAGISPRPARPIPIWFGAGRVDGDGFPSTAAIMRAARLADGFKFITPSFRDLGRVEQVTGELLRAVAAQGRDPEGFGVEVRIMAQATTPGEWPGLLDRFQSMGATHVSFANRMAGGSLDEALDILAEFMSRVSPGLASGGDARP
jgi:probable F420-dependent oxidoreductase